MWTDPLKCARTHTHQARAGRKAAFHQCTAQLNALRPASVCCQGTSIESTQISRMDADSLLPGCPACDAIYAEERGTPFLRGSRITG